jgi:diphthamide synthase (EF-2-diphthine--ammonia ligase)
MVAAGLRARITCLDPRQLPSSFCGRVFDADFLTDLPAPVDPCGERGEFHSFAYAGPMFSQPISVEHTHNVEREGFVYGDLVLTGSAPAQ